MVQPNVVVPQPLDLASEPAELAIRGSLPLDALTPRLHVVARKGVSSSDCLLFDAAEVQLVAPPPPRHEVFVVALVCLVEPSFSHALEVIGDRVGHVDDASPSLLHPQTKVHIF